MKIAYFLIVVAVIALPAVSALPGLCGTDCRINASSFPGYDPALAIIASGSTVTWHSADNAHITRDTGVGSGANTCFFVAGDQFADAPSVRFDIDGASLTATSEGTTATCTSATGNAAAGFVLQYFCAIHPTMRGALVVTN